MFNVCSPPNIKYQTNNKRHQKQSISGTPLPKQYTFDCCIIYLQKNVPPISPICIFIPPLKTVLYFVYCCLIYCRELWCGLLGWYHSPPIDDGSIVGAVISNTAYCCVYRGRDGHDGIASTAARQLVWAARLGWLLCCILINCASIVNTRRSTMHDKRRRAVYYYCCVVIVVGGGGIFIIVICLHLLLKDERDRILDMWY